MKKAFLAILCALPFVAVSAKTSSEILIDSLKESHRVILIGDGTEPTKDSVRAVIDMFYVDQFRHFQDPSAPYFMFVSKDSRFAMGIGGAVRMRGWADWGGIIPYNGFIPYAISVPSDKVNRRKITTTPAGTALYFKVIGRNERIGNYQLYIETNFDGYNQVGMKLKKAYATVNDWTVGYAPSTFGDPAAFPQLIDAQGPQAEVQTNAVLIRWMHNVLPQLTFAASIESPQSQVGYDNVNTGHLNDWAPNIAAFAQFNLNNNGHIRLSGITRFLPYQNLVTASNAMRMGWGIQLSTVMRPTKNLTIYGTGNIGEGYGSLTGDLIMGNFDLLNNPDSPGEMYAPKSWAWYAALQYNFRPDLFMSATVGQERLAPSHHIDPTTYKYGLYSAVNLFWNITPRVQVAAEVNLVKRQNFDGNHNYARRACLMTQFSF